MTAEEMEETIKRYKEAQDTILEMSEMDAFGDFQFGVRNGLWKAYSILVKAGEKKNETNHM